ncbi:MAG: RagB/SusD family nutrient uptake outer membrane protein [Muribaculaceae bacterium]|nr:RagB/SusD family nutrient uptake outer membrane protein [Muribaculaceae bacterium]
MKKSNIYLSCALALSGFAFTGCLDLDQEPMSNVVTEDQKQEVIKNDPSMAAASVATIPSMVTAYMNNWSVHVDFGYPSIMIATDSRGMDMPSNLGNYQQYQPALELEDFNGRYYLNLEFWYTFYNLIRSANSVLANVEPTEPLTKYFCGQALAFRAWAYLNLGQMYQFTYYANPQAPTVPIITEDNMTQAASEGCPRATGEQLYAQIINDLTNAIQYLAEADEEGYNRESQAEAAIVKTFVNEAVCYGLRARANLFKRDYAAAAADAAEAISQAEAEGAVPYSREALVSPQFYNIADDAWIWGRYSDISSSQFRGVVNFASFVTGWSVYGYAAAGFFRCVNKALYDLIPATDIRKGWWIDGTGTPRASLPSQYTTYINSAESNGMAPFSPYAQLKFGAVDGNPATNSGAIDLPLMRIEELKLIEAEAVGLSQSVSAGASKLADFVKNYRNPEYSFTATSEEAFKNEIWFQRRVELWGEGFSYYDMMRFQKPLDRRGGGYSSSIVFNVEPTNTVLLYDIPQAEVQRNPQIGANTNGSSIPSPVEDNVTTPPSWSN